MNSAALFKEWRDVFTWGTVPTAILLAADNGPQVEMSCHSLKELLVILCLSLIVAMSLYQIKVNLFMYMSMVANAYMYKVRMYTYSYEACSLCTVSLLCLSHPV